MQWLKEGDENIKFFHAIANGCKNRNLIPKITNDVGAFTDPKDIGNIFAKRFSILLGKKNGISDSRLTSRRF